MSFSTKQNNYILYEYRMNHINLCRVSTKRDLGVLFDPKFDFSLHVNNLVTCSYRNLGFIVRNSRDFHSIATLKSLFNCFVRAKLEYCFLIWNPLYQNSIRAIEIIQRKFARYCWYKGHFGSQNDFHYNTALISLNMLSLENRRTVQSLLFIYKLINNVIMDSNLLALLNFHVPRTNHPRQKILFSITTARTNYELKSPLRRSCSAFNVLYTNWDDIDIFFDCLLLFKKKLMTYFSLY